MVVQRREGERRIMGLFWILSAFHLTTDWITAPGGLNGSSYWKRASERDPRYERLKLCSLLFKNVVVFTFFVETFHLFLVMLESFSQDLFSVCFISFELEL